MRAVICARYSSDNQREESIEGQLRECKEYADKNDMMIVKNYIDRALSAKTGNDPSFSVWSRTVQRGCLMLFLCGNWIDLHETDMILRIIRRS